MIHLHCILKNTKLHLSSQDLNDDKLHVVRSRKEIDVYRLQTTDLKFRVKWFNAVEPDVLLE